MGKIIALARDYPEIAALMAQMNEIINRAKERSEFLKKQYEKLNKDLHQEKDAVWEAISKIIDDKKLIEDGMPSSKFFMKIDDEVGIRMVDDKDVPGGLHGLIVDLMRR